MLGLAMLASSISPRRPLPFYCVITPRFPEVRTVMIAQTRVGLGTVCRLLRLHGTGRTWAGRQNLSFGAPTV